MAKLCAICGNKVGVFSQGWDIQNAVLCKDCGPKVADALGYSIPPKISETLKMTHLSTEQAKAALDTPVLNEISDNNSDAELIDQNTEDTEASTDEFSMDRAIGDNGIYADFTSKILMTELGMLFTNKQKLYYFSDIISYTPTIEGHEVKKHHGIARAATGGILFGGAGAIVGAVTGGKQYDIVTKVAITVYLANGKTFGATMLNSKDAKADSLQVRGAKQGLDQWTSLLDRIIADNNQQQYNKNNADQTSISAADEIRKFKSLLDDGIISQTEFDSKKNELLK